MYTSIHGGQNVSAEDFHTYWSGDQISLGPATQFVAWQATAGGLSSYVSSGMGMPGMPSGGHPLMRLWRDGALEAELSNLSKQTFGVGVTLDRVNGDVRLRVGEVSCDVPPLNRPTREYADAVAALPTMEAQGDGVKSFLGLALSVIAGQERLMIVDEPEAFLHPAQARALGRWLGREAVKRRRQVILATHDRDVILGLLDSGCTENTTVIRVTRTVDGMRLHQLAESNIAAVWADPVLRYSNVLQGLFHRRVVVCEGDADCRFYGAVLDDLAAAEGVRADADDTLFVPSGGKQRAATLVKALEQLGVVTVRIVDFDILRQRVDVKTLLEALGGAWSSDIDTRYVLVRDAMNRGQSWDQAKNQGVNAMPAGPVHVAATELLSLLVEQNLFVVPVGEMEDYDKSVSGHGAMWVSSMLAKGGHRVPGVARDLLKRTLEAV